MTKPIDPSPRDPVWDDSRITAYVLEELPADQRQLFEQEMASRPGLATAVEEARQIVGDVSDFYASEPKPTLSDAHRERLDQATRQEAAVVGSTAWVNGGREASDGGYRVSGRQMLMAASVLFLLGLGSGLLVPALRDNSQHLALSPVMSGSSSREESGSRPPVARPDPADEALKQSDELASGPSRPSSVEGLLSSDSSASMTAADPKRAKQEKMHTADASAQPTHQPGSNPNATPPMEREEAAAGKNFAQNLYDDTQAAPGDAGSYGGYGSEMMGGYRGPAPGDEMGGYGGEMEGMGSEMMGGYGGAMGGYGSEMAAGYGNVKEKAQPAGTVAAGQAGQRPAIDSLAVNNSRGRRRQQPWFEDRSSTMALSALPDDPMTDRGRGPGMAGDQFQPITDNPFRRIEDHPLSTFSIDVDTASYAKVRSYLLQRGTLPRPDAVRIEELINYFDYDYAPPEADETSGDEPADPFATHIEFAACPWTPEHRLARIGIKGKEVAKEDRPPGNFVFLLDVSGSMNQPNKLPLVKQGMQMLLEQLNEQDRIAIVVYAGAAGLVLDSTPADRLADVRDALDRLQAGGSTNGGDGIQLAYNVARDHFIEGGVNRVILCTDGDFNVGTTGTDSLVRLVEEEAKGGVFLSVLGFGMGNHNDTMLEQISGRGNGNYAFIDTIDEAHKVLVEQVAGTLVTIAKDVKIQIEFNPAEVAAYRLIGYENRILAKEDFNDDTKDAGEIGAGHSVTALYELVPAGETAEPMAPEVAPLRYQIPARKSELAESGEWVTVNLRYKEPDGEKSKLISFPATDGGAEFAAASRNFQLAASVAGFGMLLRNSPYKGDWTLAAVEESAAAAVGDEPSARRSEFLEMVKKAAELSGR